MENGLLLNVFAVGIARQIAKAANRMILVDKVDSDVAIRRAIDSVLEESDYNYTEDQRDQIVSKIKHSPDADYGHLFLVN